MKGELFGLLGAGAIMLTLFWLTSSIGAMLG